jgi:hypothetical protein
MRSSIAILVNRSGMQNRRKTALAEHATKPSAACNVGEAILLAQSRPASPCVRKPTRRNPTRRRVEICAAYVRAAVSTRLLCPFESAMTSSIHASLSWGCQIDNGKCRNCHSWSAQRALLTYLIRPSTHQIHTHRQRSLELFQMFQWVAEVEFSEA